MLKPREMTLKLLKPVEVEGCSWTLQPGQIEPRRAGVGGGGAGGREGGREGGRGKKWRGGPVI